MVLSRNDKRKRKEGDLVDLMDPLAQAPKRIKIHAQRKFAQGTATPVYSPVNTPVKEKEKAKPTVFTELITHKRPNTEDFLTFLCFRGTSILPPSLNFFNANSKNDKAQDGAKSGTPSNSYSKANGTSGKPTATSKAAGAQAAAASQKSISIKEKSSNIPKKQTPAPVPKRLKQIKTTSTAIQALKKKYQEQRLAKQRLKKFKPSCMKTRSNASAIVVEPAPVKPTAPVKVPTGRKFLSSIESRRRGLRSTGLPEPIEKKNLPFKTLKRDAPVKLKKQKRTSAKDDVSSVDSFSLRGSTKKTPAKLTNTNKPLQKKLTGGKSIEKLEPRRVVTRSKAADTPPATRSPTPTVAQPAKRPTRKTKEAAALYMEILGRKLVSPDLENDDNMSLDSFPELPNARKLAQTENEMKAKVKSQKSAAAANAAANASQTGAAAAKDKEKKVVSSVSTKTGKNKIAKQSSPVPKNKRLVKVQKYCELNSDEESISSKEASDGVTTTKLNKRQSAPSIPPPAKEDRQSENRNLRSTRSLGIRRSFVNKAIITETLIQVTEPAPVKPVKPADGSTKTSKEPATKSTMKDKPSPAVTKRKREPSNLTPKEKDVSTKRPEPAKSKPSKASEAQEESEEEESLGAILDKLKKKKQQQQQQQQQLKKRESERQGDKEKNTPTVDQEQLVTTKKTSEIKSPVSVIKSSATTITNKNQSDTAIPGTKLSDDEESLFRGFAKKAISKLTTSTQIHLNAKIAKAEDADSKAGVFKNHESLVVMSGLKDIKRDIKTSAIALGVKLAQEQAAPAVSVTTNNSTAVNASVKLEPDYGESKITGSSAANPLNIIDMPKPTIGHSGRKERMNMSAEQIEKWLNESSLAKEESKVEMESVSSFKYQEASGDKTTRRSANELFPAPASHLSISPKIQHLVRPVNVTLSKLSDRLKKAPTALTLNRTTPFLAAAAATTVTAATTTATVSNQVSSVKLNQQLPPSPIKLADAVAAKEKKESSTSTVTTPHRKMSKDSSIGEDAESDVISKSDANSTADSSDKKSLSSPEKKVFFHQRKPFLPKVKERKPSSSAFSPENESSVYAFESEAEAPVSTPFRRKTKEPSAKESTEKNKTTSVQSKDDVSKEKSNDETGKITKPLNSPEEARKDEEKSPQLLERTTPKNFELPKNFADLTNVQILPLDKLTTSWSNVSCSASIAVQVNLDEQSKQSQKQQQTDKQQQQATVGDNSGGESVQRSTEISTQTEGANALLDNDDDDDNNGQLFYIPLQAVTRHASAQGGQQLIQGVAVKLGTEGPTGPNQRVLLKAKLVTKPPISVARCPPIGTVQPTARAPQNTNATQANLPSTSTPDSTDEALKVRTPDDKGSGTVTMESSQICKTSSTEKIIKSPKIKERKMSADVSKSIKKKKAKQSVVYLPVNNTTFPKMKDANEKARLVEAPVFRPSANDFKDPLEYIDKIRPIAEKFGICKVVPPSHFKPECKVSDDMRFTAYNHYVHRMLHRWGPNVKEMMAIKKYLATQSISLAQSPFIGGMEVDLPHLYQTVQTLGGLKEVIEKKKWQKVADGMKIPRSAQDRVTKLDSIYCKYLLPYDTLSQDERDKLFKEVEADWLKREKRDRQETQSNDPEDDDDEDSSEEIEECIVKGRNMPLNAFYRIARNTQRMWFGETSGQQQATTETEGAQADEVESAFWKHVVEKKRHVCVHAASIDSSGGHGYGFSVTKNSPFARHPWNLKVLTNNAGSVLRALGPQMGVTVPTLHVGMVFSACCWYRDPHGLPWIEYLHTGAKKIWYGIPDEQSSTFRCALTKMFPRYCKNKTIWLPSDTAMVPPDMLVRNDVSLCQTVQEPGQFIVVFPKAFTSSICTGYVVSESVYFAQSSWLESAEQVFQDIHDSCEPSIFSFERLLFSIINDFRSHIDVLKQILPTVIKICDKEIECRRKLKELGLTNTERVPLPENDKKGKGKKVKKEESDYECDSCRASLYVSSVSNISDGSIFCLTHAIQYIEKKKQVVKNCTLTYAYSESELTNLIDKLKDRIGAKSKKKQSNKAS